MTTVMHGPTELEGRITAWGGHHLFGCELLHTCVFTFFEKLRGPKPRFGRVCKSQSTGDTCSFRIDWARAA